MSGLSKDFDIPSVASTSQEGQKNRTLKVTLLSSEWRSSTDGDLSTINRELAIQLAKHSNVEVSVFLPQCSEEDRNNAESHDVRLVVAETLPGINPVDRLMFVPDGHVVDCVVGHGVTLGRQVQVIRKQHNCKWIQVVHTAPEELGVYKSISKGEQLQKTEVALCEKADQVVAIGPRLTDAYKRYLRCSKKEQNVFNLTPGIFSEFLDVEQATEERRTFRVLVLGSGDCCEDFMLKGFDLAAQAIAELKDKSYQLKFVGAPRKKGEEIADELLQHGIDCNQLIVRSFSDSREVLANLLCEVDLAIMPSKTEGFGLRALEALSAGLPVLVSGNSGLGEALKEVPFGSHCVIASEDPRDWAREIKAVRQKKRSVRLTETKFLREKYFEMYSWKEPIRSLVERMYSLIFGSESRPGIATGDKRPASTVLGDRHSKQFRGKSVNYDHLEALKGSLGGRSSHSSMEYGKCPFSLTSVTQDRLVQVRSPSQTLKGSLGGRSSHSSMEYGQCPFSLTSVTQDRLVQVRSPSQNQVQGITKLVEPDLIMQCPENPKSADYPEKIVELIKREYKGTVLCPFPWCEGELLFELSKIFTRLKIVGRKKERAKLTIVPVEMTDVFRPYKACDCQSDCDCERENTRVVLIEGPPGIGKTTYCQKLSYDWSVGDITTGSSFPKVDVFLRLMCRDMKTANIEDAIDDQLLPITVDKVDKGKFFHFIRRNQTRVLLVLDGLDELPKNLFEEFLPLIKGRVFPLTYVMLTARHEAGMKVRQHCDALFEIVGYTKSDADSYIKKYFRSHDKPSLGLELIMEIEKDTQLRKLTSNALNTALLCLVFEDTGGILPYNRTMLYSELVNCVLRRYCSKKEISLDYQDPIKKYANQLNQLGELALEALLKDELAFSLEELKSQSNEFLELGFLSREASASKLKPKPTYAFIHKTFQEYFAAFHVAHELLTTDRDKAPLLAQLSPVHDYWQVWKFLMTMAASKSDDTAVLLVSNICTFFQHQKVVQFSSDEDDQLKAKLREIVSSRLLKYHHVCKDAGYDCESEQQKLRPFSVEEEFSFLVKIVDAITQCEEPKRKLKPYQIKMAGMLARCFPMDEITVKSSHGGTTFNSRFPFVMSEYLKGNCKLNKLNWELNVSTAAALVDVLQTSRTLTHLHLTNGVWITSLTPALQANHTVTHLDMHGTGVSDVEAKVLGKVLQSNHTLTHLGLGNNQITPIGVEALAEALKSNKVVEHLNIGNNGIGNKGATALSQALESNQTLRYLNLDGEINKLFFGSRDHQIGNQGLQALAHALRYNSSLTYLDVHGHTFSDSSLTELGKALQSNCSLTHLYLGGEKFSLLSECCFGDSSAEVFSKALQSRDTRLTRLDLSRASISSSCVILLAEGLRVNCTLERLDLSQNHIDCPGAVALAQALKTNQTLKYLQLRENKIGDDGAKEFVEVLQYNKTLKFLGLINNQMTESGKDFFKVLGGLLESRRHPVVGVGIMWIRK